MSSRPAVRQLGRLSEIAQVAAKHGFGYLFDSRRRDGGPTEREMEVADETSTRGVRLRCAAALQRLVQGFERRGGVRPQAHAGQEGELALRQVCRASEQRGHSAPAHQRLQLTGKLLAGSLHGRGQRRRILSAARFVLKQAPHEVVDGW